MKKILKNVALILTMVTIVSCSGNTEASQESEVVQEPQMSEEAEVKEEYEPLRLAMMPTVNQIIFYVAEKEGFYDEFNVNVDLVPFKSAKDRNAAVMGNSLDGADSDYISTAMFQKADIDMRMITVTYEEFGLLAGKDTGIEKVEDLEGKTILYSKNTVVEYIIDKMLEEVGLTQDNVVMEEVPVLPARLELIREEKGDSALMPDPFKSIAEKDGINIIKTNYDLGIEATAIAITNEYYEANKGNIEGFLKAYDKSVEYLNTDEGQGKYEDFIIETLGFPEDFKGEFKLPQLQKSFAPPQGDVEEAVQWAYEKGLADTILEYDDIVITELYGN